MAKNTGEGYRRGAVKKRSQLQAHNGNFVKRDKTTGQFIQQSDHPFKGVSKEK